MTEGSVLAEIERLLDALPEDGRARVVEWVRGRYDKLAGLRVQPPAREYIPMPYPVPTPPPQPTVVPWIQPWPSTWPNTQPFWFTTTATRLPIGFENLPLTDEDRLRITGCAPSLPVGVTTLWTDGNGTIFGGPQRPDATVVFRS